MNPSPNLFLIGPMGAGKSSIGRRLARLFGMRCIDLDSMLERRTGASIATIFEHEGEAGFRRRESALLEELVTLEGIVLATGGGTILAPGNRAVMRRHGFVLWLDVTVDQQLQRLVRDRRRPLLDVPDRRQRLEQLARVRNPLYRELSELTAGAPANQTCRQAVSHIAALLQQTWQRSPAAAAPT